MEYKVINLLQTRELRAKLTKSEESFLDFLEKNFKLIPKYSVIQISELAFTSQGTINRVCKKLGLTGFSELKFAIAQDVEKMENSKNTQINNTLFYIKNINFQEVGSIIEALKGNKKILIYSLGATKLAAEYFQRQLLYLGYSAIRIKEEGMIENFEDYNLFILSSSGETTRIKHLANHFKEKKGLVISITKSGSSLHEISDCSFTHNISIDKLDVIAREQQLHMIIMANEVINRLINNIG